MRLAGLAGLGCTGTVGNNGPMALKGNDRVYSDGVSGLGTMTRINPGAQSPTDVRQLQGVISRQNNEIWTLRQKIKQLQDAAGAA